MCATRQARHGFVTCWYRVAELRMQIKHAEAQDIREDVLLGGTVPVLNRSFVAPSGRRHVTFLAHKERLKALCAHSYD